MVDLSFICQKEKKKKKYIKLSSLKLECLPIWLNFQLKIVFEFNYDFYLQRGIELSSQNQNSYLDLIVVKF